DAPAAVQPAAAQRQAGGLPGVLQVKLTGNHAVSGLTFAVQYVNASPMSRDPGWYGSAVTAGGGDAGGNKVFPFPHTFNPPVTIEMQISQTPKGFAYQLRASRAGWPFGGGETGSAL